MFVKNFKILLLYRAKINAKLQTLFQKQEAKQCLTFQH